MNPSIQLKKAIPLFLLALTLICFPLLPNAQAAPETGLPGFNTADGANALGNVTTGVANSAFGWFSLFSDTDASFNTATGAGALLFNTAGNNTAVGAAALLFNTTGERNTAVGTAALLNNSTGPDNTAIGDGALLSNTTGISNTAVGAGALSNIATGIANTAIGKDAGTNVTTANNVICIGSNAFGADLNDSCFIGNIRGVTTANADAIPVLIDSNNQLGTVSSSRQFKKDIKPMDKASEAILALKPVSFRYKSETKRTPQFGLIAEEVAEVNPNLVVRDKNGEIYTVRYEAVNAMLLNEFLKEHRKVEDQNRRIQEQEATIARLKQEFGTNIAQQAKQIEALAATVKEQTSQIQKVTAQLKISKPAQQGGAEQSVKIRRRQLLLAKLARTVPNWASSGTGDRAESFSPGAFFPLFQTCTATGQLTGGQTEKGK